MMLSRREWLLAAGALAGCSRRPTATGCAALAGKTIRWIVPFGDGGSHEVYSRLIEPFYERALGAEIVVVTEPGNGGIVGATKLRDAAPDGRTVGILNGAGLFVAAVAGEENSPNPARDFSVLGRLGRSRPLITAAASSRIKSIEDVLELQKSRPIVCGVSGRASNSLTVFAICEHLLGLRLDYIAGFAGSRESVLAGLRGEIDLQSSNLDSLQQAINQGDLRPLLQVADAPINDDPSLKDVPVLGGPHGWAARRAPELGRESKQAISDARGFVDLSGAGIVVAAPKGLPGELLACMRTHLYNAASSTDFQSAARAALRTPDVADGQRAQDELSAVEPHMARFAPIVREAFRRARK
jgi:tripartite-type tricarboxylate transporter receptor subunit TctC